MFFMFQTINIEMDKMEPPQIKNASFLWGCSWSLLGRPGFKLMLPESNESKLK